MKSRALMTFILAVAVGFGLFRTIAYVTRDDGDTAPVVIPVEVTAVKEETFEEVLTYQGTVAPTVTETVAFKSTGRLAAFNGTVGESLEAGSVLASLDSSDLEKAYDSAGSQLAAAQADYSLAQKGAGQEDLSMASINVDKAREAVDYLSDLLADTMVMLEEGIVSQSELDGLQLELTLAEQDLALAQESYDKAVRGTDAEMIDAAAAQVAMAKTNVDVQQSLLEDSVYTLKESRVLIQQLYEPGELVAAGYPVAVLRSLEQEVVIGVSGKDLDQIHLGQEVRVTVAETVLEGTVSRIAELPDSAHYLYEVAVDLGDGDLLVGEIVTCEVILGERQMVAIPITAIMNDGIDYVYLAKEGEAVIRKIEILDIHGGNALVAGLEPGEMMVVNNLNRIHERSLIQVEE